MVVNDPKDLDEDEGNSEGIEWLRTARPIETQKLHQIC
jgi:hypothetical protein